jgi:VIT1/CCC1 family predicted Fe2+/Mn2+ transporter
MPVDLHRAMATLRDERDGAALYEALAAVEREPRLAEVYRRLAEVERRHAQVWSTRIAGAGGRVPAYRPSLRTRLLIALARRFGPGFVLPSITGVERADAGRYAPEDPALAADEASHARVLSQVTAATGGLSGAVLAQLEGRHRAIGGNALRAAVLGANDGLVSNLSLVMGVAGAELSGRAIIITGFAGLLAGAISMALGEWLSVQSSRELYQHQLRTEAAEIRDIPEEEARELVLIYQARGLPEDQARALAAQIMSDEARALDTLAREELGIVPGELGGSAWEAAGASFLLFALGAVMPVAPFLFLDGTPAVLASLALSAVGLFAVGAGITLFTARPVAASGLRQVTFGLAAAAVTYTIGRLVGVNLGG